ncbi:aldehyde dehydrogenase family protein [Brevibacillus fluminis]|uniref:Aldehyde dehydrogenase family protein n=1 Tax=Brevibacillus fluminis TaxID=511487 RepID=A0A3M8DP82_9BACL|nr:aldehyde dehydrogenase family protein [Brevibacillus fluminis]RNB89844.1 aldehyde dehydrogenase family protein [Brevibacillus fluminis]
MTTQAKESLKLYIAGEWVDAADGNVRDVFNPATGEVIAVVAEAGLEDVRRAIAEARRVFDETDWQDTPPHERARLLNALADKLDERADEFARLETENNGKPLRESLPDVADAANCFRYYAGLINKPLGQTYQVADPMMTMVVREPIGVCGQIVPWNYPLLMAAWKLAPCLAAGNTTVFKPSELTPLTAVKLFELIDEVGFPKGVANLVMGAGNVVGHELAASDQIDKVAFTGGTATGRSIMQTATGNLKNISLELGGKSPHIIFADADFEAALEYAMFGIFANQGQVCSAGSRLLVEDALFDRFIEALVERSRKIRVGNGIDELTEMGPLISKAHMEKVLGYIEIGKVEGARLVLGGNPLIEGDYANGNFVEPTIFVDCKPEMRIVQEEIFGPVLTVQRFKTEEEAIRLANDSMYGLAGGVFSQDGAKAMRVIKKLRAGITWINTYHPTYNEAPWGGYKQSGIGRELGTFGLEAYQEVKQINMNLQVGPMGWYNND